VRRIKRALRSPAGAILIFVLPFVGLVLLRGGTERALAASAFVLLYFWVVWPDDNLPSA
jgi:hypothetical protein